MKYGNLTQMSYLISIFGRHWAKLEPIFLLKESWKIIRNKAKKFGKIGHNLKNVLLLLHMCRLLLDKFTLWM